MTINDTKLWEDIIKSVEKNISNEKLRKEIYESINKVLKPLGCIYLVK